MAVGICGTEPLLGFKTMAHVSVNAVQPVSFYKENVITHVTNSISDAINTFKANRQERRVQKILAGLDPRIVRDILPQ